MNICIWSSNSFDHWYSSYHLMKMLLLEILKSGHNIWLVQMQYDDGTMPYELTKYKTLNVINIPQGELSKTNFVRRIIKQLRYFYISQFKIKKINNLDVIFLQSNNVAYFPVEFARKNKIPIIYNVQDIFPINALIIGKISKRNPIFIISRYLQSEAYRKADRVVTISKDLAKTINKEMKYERHIDIVYNWSYQNTPCFIKESENHFLKKYKISKSNGFRIVYAGNVGQMLDINLIIEVAKELQQYHDIKIYIIGDGSNLIRLSNMIKKHSLGNILIFPRQPMEYAVHNYCMAHVNIIPLPKYAIYTCMPSKINTCLLCGKPTVIAMDLDSYMAKQLKAIDKWEIIPPGDVNTMVQFIRKIYKSDNWNINSTNSCEFIQKFCSIENIHKYLRIIQESIKR